jgi:hypothetical protein
MLLDMHRRRRVWIFGLLAAGVAAGVAVQASSAAPNRAIGAASTVDATYSCSVASQHTVVLYGGVTLPPANGRAQPGVFALTTGTKSVTKNGTTTTKSQLGFSARKNSLKIDKSSCQRVNKKIALTRKGLSGPPATATPNLYSHVTMNCGTAAKVLVRFRLTLQAGVPTQALVAMRNENAKNRPVAFYDWNPRKITAYTANSCVQTG